MKRRRRHRLLIWASVIALLFTSIIVIRFWIPLSQEPMDSVLKASKRLGYLASLDAPTGYMIKLSKIPLILDYYTISSNNITRLPHKTVDLLVPASDGIIKMKIEYQPFDVAMMDVRGCDFSQAHVELLDQPYNAGGYCTFLSIGDKEDDKMLLYFSDSHFFDTPNVYAGKMDGFYLVDLSEQPAGVKYISGLLSQDEIEQANLCSDRRHLFLYSKQVIGVYDLVDETWSTIDLPLTFRDRLIEGPSQYAFGTWDDQGILKMALSYRDNKTSTNVLYMVTADFSRNQVTITDEYSPIFGYSSFLLSEDLRAILVHNQGFQIIRLSDMTIQKVNLDERYGDFESDALYISPDYRYIALMVNYKSELMITDLAAQKDAIIRTRYHHRVEGYYNSSFSGFIDSDFAAIQAGRLDHEIYFKTSIDDLLALTS
jgi:hypothetical protein